MITGIRHRTMLGAALAALLGAACASSTNPRNVEVTHDGLERVANSRADRAWVKPDADFKAYTEVELLDCMVSFRRNWKSGHQNVRSRDIERIKSGLSEEFRNVFTEELEKGGYPVVAQPGEHVLLIRPAIIDLDIAAPDTNTAGRSKSFTTSPGVMTLVIEFYDSVSGEILARAIDRKRARNVGRIPQWTTAGTNRDDARKILRRWADLIVDRLDEVHGEPDQR